MPSSPQMVRQLASPGWAIRAATTATTTSAVPATTSSARLGHDAPGEDPPARRSVDVGGSASNAMVMFVANAGLAILEPVEGDFAPTVPRADDDPSGRRPPLPPAARPSGPSLYWTDVHRSIPQAPLRPTVTGSVYLRH